MIRTEKFLCQYVLLGEGYDADKTADEVVEVPFYQEEWIKDYDTLDDGKMDHSHCHYRRALKAIADLFQLPSYKVEIKSMYKTV